MENDEILEWWFEMYHSNIIQYLRDHIGFNEDQRFNLLVGALDTLGGNITKALLVKYDTWDLIIFLERRLPEKIANSRFLMGFPKQHEMLIKMFE